MFDIWKREIGGVRARKRERERMCVREIERESEREGEGGEGGGAMEGEILNIKEALGLIGTSH